MPPGRRSRDAIIEGAEKEGGIVWYEAFTRDEGHAILREFQRQYPFVKKFDYLELPASQKQARFVQESLAGGPTTDVFLSSSAGLMQFVKQNFIVEGDWTSLGLPPSEVSVPNPYLIMYTTAIYVGVYNTKRVSEADVPKTWDDLLDPTMEGTHRRLVARRHVLRCCRARGASRRRGTMCASSQPCSRASMAGRFRSRRRSAPARSTSASAATMRPPASVLKGAPVKMFALDPNPISLLYGCVARHGRNPNTARLLLTWLASKDGALAFEKVTHRGNYLVTGNQQRQGRAGAKPDLLQGRRRGRARRRAQCA